MTMHAREEYREEIMAAAKAQNWQEAFRLFQTAGLEESGYGHSEAVDRVIGNYEAMTPADAAVVCAEQTDNYDLTEYDEVLSLLDWSGVEAASRSAEKILEARAVKGGTWTAVGVYRGDMSLASAGVEFDDEDLARDYAILQNAGSDGTESSYCTVVGPREE